MKKERKFFKKAAGFMIAAVMALSVIGIVPQNVNAAEASFGAGKGTVVITDDQCSYVTGDKTYIQVKPKQDGYLKLTFRNASAIPGFYSIGMATLYDASRTKALSAPVDFDTNSTRPAFSSECYGLQKNKTYYIEVQSMGGVAITAKMTKVKNITKKTQKKAAKINRGAKGVTAVVVGGKASTHWYKFTLSKPAKLQVNITPFTTGPLTVTVKGPGSGNSTSPQQVRCRGYVGDNVVNYNWGYKTALLGQKGKVAKGTYYVQVRTSDRTTTGYYKLNWK